MGKLEHGGKSLRGEFWCVVVRLLGGEGREHPGRDSSAVHAHRYTLKISLPALHGVSRGAGCCGSGSAGGR